MLCTQAHLDLAHPIPCHLCTMMFTFHSKMVAHCQVKIYFPPSIKQFEPSRTCTACNCQAKRSSSPVHFVASSSQPWPGENPLNIILFNQFTTFGWFGWLMRTETFYCKVCSLPLQRSSPRIYNELNLNINMISTEIFWLDNHVCSGWHSTK